MLTRKAKEYRMLNLEDIGEAEYTLLKHEGMLYEYFPEATGIYEDDMSRIDNIGQNGNDGEHYKYEQLTGYEQYCTHCNKKSARGGTRCCDNPNYTTHYPYRVSGDDNPDGVNIDWPHESDDDYATKIEKLYEPEKDNMFVDDYDPNEIKNPYYSNPISPSHYEIGNTGIEAIDIIQATLTKEEYIGYLRGNILKYNLRASKKNGSEDLHKADIYSGWLVEALEE